MKRPLLAGRHPHRLDAVRRAPARLFLASLYDASRELWRPFDQMNVTLIYAASLALISAFVGIYSLLVRPKSLGTGLALGAFVGLALGVSVGFGPFIHMPIPPAVAWSWFIGGWVKGLVGRRDRGSGDRRVPKPAEHKSVASERAHE